MFADSGKRPIKIEKEKKIINIKNSKKNYNL